MSDNKEKTSKKDDESKQDVSTHDEAREPSYLVAKKGLASWLVTVDHKRIGLMYLAATLFFFLVAGLLAIAVRTELFTPGQDFMSAQTYNKVFTLHGAIMVFLFIIPSVPAAMDSRSRNVIPLNRAAFWKL